MCVNDTGVSQQRVHNGPAVPKRARTAAIRRFHSRPCLLYWQCTCDTVHCAAYARIKRAELRIRRQRIEAEAKPQKSRRSRCGLAVTEVALDAAERYCWASLLTDYRRSERADLDGVTECRARAMRLVHAYSIG